MNDSLSPKYLVAVTAGRWQLHGILSARSLGINIIGIDADPKAEGLAHVDIPLVIDLSKTDEVLARLRELNVPLAGAVSFCSEAGMRLAASIREHFHLPGPDRELTERLVRKDLQRECWARDHVAGPERCVVYSTPTEALADMSTWRYPCIVKPVDSAGSRGVTKVQTPSDYASSIDYAFAHSKNQQILVESYMDGTEFTVEVFANRGEIHVLAVTEKKKVPGTGGVVASELATPDRPRHVVDRLASTVVSAFRSLGYVSGPGHAEIILLNDGSVGMVEVAGRGGGFMVFNRLVPAASGVDIARLTALDAVGAPIEAMALDRRAVVLRFFPTQEGILKAIHGMEHASRIPGVDIGFFASIGDRMNRPSTDGDRLGYILSQGTTPLEARERANRAESCIEIEVGPLP